MKSTTFARSIERLRLSALVIGFLLALLVGVGPLQTISLRPPDVQAQEIVICTGETPTNIVQDCDLRADGFASLESQAVDALLALHQLPASDASRIRAWERDAVRALMFSELIEMTLKEPADRTLLEQSIVAAMADVVRQRRIDAAQYSIDQYNIWADNPCTYQAPHGFTYETDDGWCSLPLVQLFDHPDAPTVNDFLNYGFAEINQEFKDDGAAVLIAGETARLLGLVAGALAVGIAAWIGGVIGSAIATTTAIVTAIHPVLATTIAIAAKSGVALSAVQGAAGIGALSIGALVAVIVLAIVIIVFQAISVIEQTQIPVLLQEALTQAQDGVDLRQLAQSQEGKTEIFAAFLLKTLPDFPNTGSVPAAQATDRTFIITDPQGPRVHSHTLSYQCWNPRDCAETNLAHTARIHAGWFVDKSDTTGAEQMTTGIDYIDWNGEGWTASRIGPQEFLHTRTSDDSEEPFEPFVSEQIKYLDPSGNQLIAVLNHPPTPMPRPAVSDTVNDGTFQLDWFPGSTDEDDESVTYTLYRCPASTYVLDPITEDEFCDESVVASGLTALSYAFTADAPEIAGEFRYRVRATDGYLQGESLLTLPVLVDRAAPVITLSSRTPAANAYGWNNTDVTVEWSCSDPSADPSEPATGVVSETVSETVTAEGEFQSATGVCKDTVGNTATDVVLGISIDKTLPIALFDGPYVVNEGSSIQLSSINSTDALSGIASAVFALDGDDQFDDGDPATFDGIEGPSVHPVKLRVEDRAGNVAIAETTVTVNNVAPTIDEMLTNGPVSQGQPVELTLNASDPGVLDTHTFAFDCDEDGAYETAGAGNQGMCALDPAAAGTTIGVQVMDDDGGVATSSVAVSQTLTLCLSYATGTLSGTAANGTCEGGERALTLQEASPVTLCIGRYTGHISWSPTGSCPATAITHLAPGSRPLAYCESRYTGTIRANMSGRQCTAYERAGVIPG